MATRQYVVFFKYRRKYQIALTIFLLSACWVVNGEEIYQCNNETQTCVTELDHTEQNDQGPLPVTANTRQPGDQNFKHCRGKVILNQSSGFISDGPGNYSLSNRCTWVVQSPVKNSTIRLQVLEFASECSWDHLYVYDGDSVFSPVLAVYSGLTLEKGYKVREVNQLTSSSEVVMLHFYSDPAVNMTGFNLSYSINQCPTDEAGIACYGKGVCIEGSCTCDAGYSGNGCQFPICPNNCSRHGRCDMEAHSCVCDDGWTGLDCGQQTERGSWTKLQSVSWDNRTSTIPKRQLARSQSSGGAWKGLLWIVGGHSFDPGAPFTLAFNISGSDWSAVPTSGESSPSPRYGHSAVIHDGVLYMYGGVTQDGLTSSQLWTLDLATHQWNLVTVERLEHCQQHRICGPIGASGHGAVLVKDKMYAIFGFNPVYGYLNWIQEYSIDSNVWSIVTTSGALVQGSYGPSAVWDPLTKKIYIYGGYQSISSTTYGLTDALYSFDPSTRLVRVHTPSGSFRYLHSAVMSSGLMLVYGGNVHNETTLSNNFSYGAKCYAADFIAYDVFCDAWYRLNAPSLVSVTDDLARYGHLALTIGPTQDNESLEDYQQPLLPYGMLVFGGFDGQLKDDTLLYVMGSCPSLTNKESCLTAMPGVKCVWNKSAKKCEPLTSLSKDGYEKCPGNSTNSSHALFLNPNSDPGAQCAAITTCPSCLHTTFGCVWCGHTCQHARCKDGGVNASGKMVTLVDQCETGDASSCKLFHSCSACHTEQHCRWEPDSRCYTYVRKVGNRTEKAELERGDQWCDLPCSSRTSCKNCTQGNCLWCAYQNRCVDKNAYVPSFPYGTCTDWTHHESKCKDTDYPEPQSKSTGILPLGSNVYMKMTTCNSYKVCSECQEDPACGWCDDGSNWGTGVCLPGGLSGPRDFNSTVYGNTSTQCPSSRWYFTQCPLCQCNGHSSCVEGSSQCIQPCQHLTEGSHCENCIAGYYGRPINGGSCSPCQCNGHGSLCHHQTGRCFCTTKGVIGDQCEKCDIGNHYSAGSIAHHPGSANSSSQMTCYYDLQLDFQFTFNLSKKEDRHIGQINFRNVPLKPDVDLDFSITCSIMARINISVRTSKADSDVEEEQFLLLNHNFTHFKKRFLRTDFHFGSEENTTFYIYVYDFKAPVQIIVSFSQQAKLELQQFFITFSACFISLLGMAAILWKIKQKYDMYRRRQRLFVEMEQMASRPFAHVFVELQVPKGFPPRPPIIYPSSAATDGRSRSVAVNMTTAETTFCQAVPSTTTNSLSSPPLVTTAAVGSQAIRKRRKLRVSPIALEPCADQKAAVLSLLIRLPNGTLPYAPPGQSGLAIGSTLVSLGSQASRKSSSGPADAKESRPLPKAKTPPTLTQIT